MFLRSMSERDLFFHCGDQVLLIFNPRLTEIRRMAAVPVFRRRMARMGRAMCVSRRPRKRIVAVAAAFRDAGHRD